MACIYQPYRCKGIFEELIRHGKDIRAMGNTRLAVIGEGTKKALQERGLLADFVPSVYDGDTLGKELSELLSGGERYLSRGQKRAMKSSRHFLHRQVL